MSDAIEIERLTAERDHYRAALAAQTARVRRLRVVATVARTVGRHLRDHTCTPGPCWECSLAGMIDDALEDLEPGDIEEDP